MTDISLDKVIHDAMALRPDEQQRLVEFLTRQQEVLITHDAGNHPPPTIEQVAAQQGKGPIDFDEIRRLGRFFPQDEKVDDLVNLVRDLRQDKSERILG